MELYKNQPKSVSNRRKTEKIIRTTGAKNGGMIIMYIKKLFTLFCSLLFSLAIMPPSLTEALRTNAAAAALWPLPSEYTEITTYFDPNRNQGGLSGHNAIDLPAPQDTPIYAVADGICVSSDWMGDYGNLVILRHENLGIYTFYAHCYFITAEAGQTVSAGDVIAYVGNTGASYGNHLHYGICDRLEGGYPTVTYYDPMTYFTYSMEQAPEKPADPIAPEEPEIPEIPEVPEIPEAPEEPADCECSEEISGMYTTKNITTYLNVRSGHSSDSGIVGKILPGDIFEVTKGNGKWAHVKIGDISGFCSMEYITPYVEKPEKTSKMTISDPVYPAGNVYHGKPLDVGGIISSELPITRFTGGIYEADGVTPVCVVEKNPNSLTYNMSGEFDNKMLFNELETGRYIYSVEAEDSSGKVFPIIFVYFNVVEKVEKGDVNGDGVLTVCDGVLLQKYILGIENLTDGQLKNADLSGDSCVDIFDMVMLRKILTE